MKPMITSTQNDTVKHIVKLQNKAYRQEHNQFIAQGHGVCATLLAQEYKLTELYLTQSALEKHQSEFKDLPITIVSDQVMKKISTTTTPSGIIGIFTIPEQTYTPTNNALALYNIQDPGNMGTLIRTAAAMNITNVFVIDGVDQYSPKVIQATAGTIAYITIISTDWQTFTKNHQRFDTCALVVKDGQNPAHIDISQSILIVGNEGQGLPEQIIKSCTQQMTIPMPGKTESLNAAIAGSIALYVKSLNS